jgi:NADPH:quinone reductase-like Zn-dependent oxidoreductase
MAAVSPRRPEGGAQQELLVIPAASAVPIPERASLTEAATLPMNGLTALRGLDMLGLSEGQTLAVAGGAGLLGSYVIPLAKERGLRVVADAKSEDEDLVRGFGADTVIPRSDSFADAVREAEPDGVDAVYDTALLYRDAFGAVRDGGQIVVVRGWDGNEVEERGIRVHPVMVFRVLERTDWLEELRELASIGRLKLRVARELPPEQAAEAHRLMDAGGLRGRAVIVF